MRGWEAALAGTTHAMADPNSPNAPGPSTLLYGVASAVMLIFALNDMIARRNLRRHGDDPLAAQEDETETVPSAHLIPDETALGDTAEAHAELSPHDVPADAPNRHAVEVEAAREDGSDDATTRGDEHGAAGGRQLRAEEAPPSRT